MQVRPLACLIKLVYLWFRQALIASWDYSAFVELAMGYKLASDDDDETDEDEKIEGE